MRTFLKDRDFGGLVRRHAVLFGAVVAVMVFGFVIYTVVDRQKQNRQAIEKGCILLNNAIISSTTVAGDPKSASAALVQGVLEVIPAKYVRLYKQRVGAGQPVIPLVDCEKVADHPEDIQAIPLPVPSP